MGSEIAVEHEGWQTICKEAALAYGRAVPGGFLVRAGSTAMRSGSPNKKRDRAERDKLVEQGILVPDENSDVFCFTTDHVFSSRSRAAGVVIDGNSNGNHWKAAVALPFLVPSNPFSLRLAIEAAMDAYDSYLQSNVGAEIFDAFGMPRDYWVRSTRQRVNPVYPTKPIVGYLRGMTTLNGGWGQKHDAAAFLHNAGYIIVDAEDRFVRPPERYEHLIRDADRIRLGALNYYIEPARERGEIEALIRVGKLHDDLGLDRAWANVCQVLQDEKFLKLANLSQPRIDGPKASSATTFTFCLASEKAIPTMTLEEENTFSPTNLILYGPPGTGKTYATAWEAVRLCLGDDAAAPMRTDRAALMAEYKRLCAEGRIEFTTFHQSMSYEEFVEGLRPVTDTSESAENTGAGFRLEPVPGLFGRIARRAEASHGQSRTGPRLSLEGRKIFKMSIGAVALPEEAPPFSDAIREGCAIFGFYDVDFSDLKFSDREEIRLAAIQRAEHRADMAPTRDAVQMTDMFRNGVQQGDILLVSKGNLLIRAIGEVTGDYEFSTQAVTGDYVHRRAVRWLWVDEAGVPASDFYSVGISQRTIYPLDRAALNVATVERYMNSGAEGEAQIPDPFVLIIDEINRANISKVLGELITLLEPDKRIGANNEIRLRLPYSGKQFGLPANLHIIGTMNTADRSIALLDTALRRRFAFRELMPDASVLPANCDGVNLQRLLETLNARIEYLFDREHQIGHAYFTACSNRTEVEEVMRHKVIPLLAEYFYEDWAKVAAVLGDGVGRPARFIEALPLSAPPGLANDELDEGKWRWMVKRDFDFSEFAA